MEETTELAIVHAISAAGIEDSIPDATTPFREKLACALRGPHVTLCGGKNWLGSSAEAHRLCVISGCPELNEGLQ